MASPFFFPSDYSARSGQPRKLFACKEQRVVASSMGRYILLVLCLYALALSLALYRKAPRSRKTGPATPLGEASSAAVALCERSAGKTSRTRSDFIRRPICPGHLECTRNRPWPGNVSPQPDPFDLVPISR